MIKADQTEKRTSGVIGLYLCLFRFFRKEKTSLYPYLEGRRRAHMFDE